MSGPLFNGDMERAGPAIRELKEKGKQDDLDRALRDAVNAGYEDIVEHLFYNGANPTNKITSLAKEKLLKERSTAPIVGMTSNSSGNSSSSGGNSNSSSSPVTLGNKIPTNKLNTETNELNDTVNEVGGRRRKLKKAKKTKKSKKSRKSKKGKKYTRRSA
jgi:hypothetical protein